MLQISTFMIIISVYKNKIIGSFNMRKNMVTHESNGYKIIVVDDEQGIVDSLSIFLKRSGYDFCRPYQSFRGY